MTSSAKCRPLNSSGRCFCTLRPYNIPRLQLCNTARHTLLCFGRTFAPQNAVCDHPDKVVSEMNIAAGNADTPDTSLVGDAPSATRGERSGNSGEWHVLKKTLRSSRRAANYVDANGGRSTRFCGYGIESS